jgi:hypothetical protein
MPNMLNIESEGYSRKFVHEAALLSKRPIKASGLDPNWSPPNVGSRTEL